MPRGKKGRNAKHSAGMLSAALSVLVLAVKKNYCINHVVKTLTIDVDKEATAKTGHVHFEFLINIIKSPEGRYMVQVFRNEMYELKPLNAKLSHEDVFVRDLFLVDDRMKFNSESEAMNYILKRLDELFGV